ncbi:MAG TPA: hypothetical protein VNI83_01510 [Vicinamibacterales bacterium]|nr:hypothetical protein [Vicinamibacterales bacterium]
MSVLAPIGDTSTVRLRRVVPPGCAAKGYRLKIVSSDAFSREKLDQMAALGAELTLVPSEGGAPPRR